MVLRLLRVLSLLAAVGAVAPVVPNAAAQEAMANDLIGKFKVWIVLDFRFALTTAEDRTAYAYANDATLLSTCIGPCAKSWRPVVAIPGDIAYEPFAIFTREDGLRQWAYAGRPLYTHAGDRRPGETNGHGLDGAWEVVEVPAHAMQ